MHSIKKSTKKSIKKTLSYYRDCYKEDSADLNLWNLLKIKQIDRLILQGQDDVGSQFLKRLPIPAEFAEEMQKRVDTYQRERVLLYASFFVIGRIQINGESKQIAAPLLFNEASIEKDEHSFYFSQDFDSPEVNQALVQALTPEDGSIPVGDDVRHLQSAELWTEWAREATQPINYLTLLNFPKLSSVEEVEKAFNSKSLHLLPVSMLVLVERSTSSRGVIHELDQINDSETLSSPLNALYSEQAKSNAKPASVQYEYLPGLLSKAQQKIITIAAHESIGCVSGPPGTGKSYTIAATAAENMSRHQSVLIVAHTEAALEVIGDKLEQNFNLGDVSIRAGKKEYLKQLKDYLSSLLSGYFSETIIESEKEVAAQLKKINKQLGKIEREFIKDCKGAIKRGQRIKKFEDAQAKFWFDLYLLFTRGKIKDFGNQWKKLDHINQLLEKRESLASRYLTKVKEENLKVLINKHRKSLQAFNKAIRSRTSKRQSEYFEEIEFKVLLSAFPVWLVSLSTLHKVLPLTKEMFDLVIIDEATQCNISSCIPAFYRAKRALVVGDTKQLRHYSFLSRSKQQQILDSHQLSSSLMGITSYRDNSILDLALDSLDSENQIAFLDEHFRSNPELIHFSNRQFYQDKLKVMQHRPCTSSGFLHLIKVDGVRDKKGINKLEADSVISKIKQYVAADSEQKFKKSIGVVSPFRNQAEYLEKIIEKRFSQDEILSHSIRISTPFGFQGEERDIMLLSFSLDNQSKRATSYLNKQDVFNVAITRARQKQYLFLSVDTEELPPENLLRTYLESVNEFKAEHEVNLDNDEFQKDVARSLKKMGIDCWPGYTIAGQSIDLLCRKNDIYLALDLIGFPGPWADFFELDTYKIFKRAGINILPISYGVWRQDRQACLDAIAANLMLPKKLKE